MQRRVSLIALSAAGLIAAAPIGALSAGAAAAGPAHPDHSSSQSRPAAEHVPRSVHRAVLTERNGIPSHVVRHGTIHGHAARKLVRDYDQLPRAPKGAVYSCPNDTGLRKIAKFRANRHVWVANENTCGFVKVKRDGHHLPTLRSDKAYRHALNKDLAQTPKSS